MTKLTKNKKARKGKVDSTKLYPWPTPGIVRNVRHRQVR